ncbi:MAG: cryptochrome/photolyase family protein [Blastocatellia bacterium]|nr:cryptochrome/photolyase family protein [Blastocatellia bacterium]
MRASEKEQSFQKAPNSHRGRSRIIADNRQPTTGNRQPATVFPMTHANESIWILGDQLMADHPLLDPARRAEQTVVMIESLGRMTGRRYHKRKLTLVLSAMRHYAEELRGAGWRVDYREAPSFAAGLRAHLAEFGSSRLRTMAAAEWGARERQRGLASSLGVEVEIARNAHFLSERFAPEEKPGKRLVLEYFYRAMRRHFGVLLDEQGEPVGGAWNFDKENRRPYDAKLRPRPPIAFAPDGLTEAVMEKIERDAAANIGSTRGFAMAVTRAQARAALDDFIAHRLPDFGAYEDAMAEREPLLFHSALSPLLNLGLLDPLDLVRRAEAAWRAGEAPLNAVEGFVRQILGWREYVYWRYHRMMPGFHERNHWQADRPLPEFFWTGETEMNCLRRVIGRVLETGYSHHIERLMVLCNFALLAGVRPAEVNDWFLECYADAYDWVVTPNVVGMGLCADGGVVGTKPYVASAAYINRMSDYCRGCRYDPKARTGETACPFNFLYWSFLLRFEAQLRANPRMGPNVLGLKHLDSAERDRVARQAAAFQP